MREVKVFSRNTFLWQEGEHVRYVYWIRRGTTRAFFINDEGNEQVIRFGYSGDFITDVNSLIRKEPSQLYLQTIKECEVILISLVKLEEAKRKDTNLAAVWAHMMENLVCQQMEREVDLLTSDPKIRYQRVLVRSPRLFQEIPSRHIANYLRMTPETFSRVKKS